MRIVKQVAPDNNIYKIKTFEEGKIPILQVKNELFNDEIYEDETKVL